MVLTQYCKQRIIQIYFKEKVSYGNLVQILKDRLKASKKSVWMTIRRYERHGTILHLPGSGRLFKLTCEMLNLIEDRLHDDDETTALQLLQMLNDKGYNVSKQTIIRARKILGWTFHGSRYCQLLRPRSKEKRVK